MKSTHAPAAQSCAWRSEYRDMRKRSAALFKAVCVVFSVCTLVLCLLWRVRLAQAEENIAAIEDALKEAETEARVLTAKYDSSISLEELDSYARGALGMQPPEPGQIVYLDWPG